MEINYIATYELAEKYGFRFGTTTLNEKDSHSKQEKEIERIFNAKYKRNFTINYDVYDTIVAVIFNDHIRFFTKPEEKYDDPFYFATYDCTTGMLYVFSNHCTSLSYYNELYGLTKQDVINQLCR